MLLVLPLRICALLLVLTTCLASQDTLQLGKMWTFDKPPLAYLEKEYGFKPTAEWLDQVRLASLRFGDWCSASFVSPKGLIMTNHHCVRDQIARASPKNADWVKNGFYATAMTEEAKLVGVSVSQLISMRDVTVEVNADTDGKSPSEVAEQQKRNEAKLIEAAKTQAPELKPQVVKLHQGASYMLYSYRVFDDIRLVCAPNLQTAHFGGDPDNFTYPRYSIDFAFCRAYVDDKPADTAGHYFHWSNTGPNEGELVFVTGNPGSTGRLLTYAQMEYLRDAEYPMQIDLLDTQIEILRQAMREDPELEKRMRTQLLMLENSQKAIRGYHSGLLDAELMARKRAAETALRTKIAADPDLSAKFSGTFESLAAVARKKTALYPRQIFQSSAYSNMLTRALAVANATNADLAQDERQAATTQATEFKFASSALRVALFRNHVRLGLKWLGRSDPYLTELMRGHADVDAMLLALSESRMRDDEYVKELLAGGAAAVEASDDIAIRTARVLSRTAHETIAVEKQLSDDESVLATRVGQALFAVYGDGISPDATMTLRLSDGLVKGYNYNGTLAPWRTTFHGLYGRNAEFDDKPPFDLPGPWKQGKDSVEMTKSVCFVSTNDIIGGNSGSPIINRDRQVVGLVFDGNIEQLPNRFVFRDSVQRTVSVHVHAIIEALNKIYDAEPLANELLGNQGK